MRGISSTGQDRIPYRNLTYGARARNPSLRNVTPLKKKRAVSSALGATERTSRSSVSQPLVGLLATYREIDNQIAVEPSHDDTGKSC